MKQSKTVVLDVDGVLGDFCSAALEVFYAVTGRIYSLDMITEWDMEKLLPEELRPAFFHHCGQPGFCSRIKPYYGAVPFVEELRRRGHTVVIATSPWNSPYWIEERMNWLRDHFGVAHDVHNVKDKTGVPGDVFLDDKPSHVVTWAGANPGGKAFLFNQMYNQGPQIPRVANYADFLRKAEL